MDKIILQAKNKKDLDDRVKRTIKLNNDETYIIKEIKRPFNFLFINIKGKYEISILKKSELEKIKKLEEEKIKLAKAKKVETKEVKTENIEEKIKELFEEFIKATNLDIKIKKISNYKNQYTINVEGKDVRYIIGEKGQALSSLEYLINSLKELKNYKVFIDANNYKAKREETLRNLANKKAQKVLETKTSYKLHSMTAKERRIIHEEISKYENLSTESHGEEPKRFLVIKYNENKER
ncbi:protein jag [Caviibacter abscessus]|uniref:Jag family protein n=1 Tax=Caviibacter abscessus TaxID=1766719 RepID=UPI0008386399|nr:R3H domain-containing nucleic acid-binding protein [Caviibacter abscessus]